ncbi:Uncharacterised protein [BD1-7 clade bacterium]|uniref:Gamma-glutamylcyclotransferase n=1 Tax=BD1-7 clade bacterium TaxID=2029982 RepID=A0A5S9P9J5_9GAMM|nr:Uncharacterised protein [BD1-7 clade bacterium]CAA0101231.1 Uncharacterised protein [BD1-7 clade bacterium]
MFHYFGFGSNMSLASLAAKGVLPLNSRRATLAGWRLRFNVQHFFRHEGGVGNIEFTGNTDDRVLGVLHECTDDALPLLDAAEAYGYGYNRVSVDVTVDTTEKSASKHHHQMVNALTYIGMPEFINDECRPSQRYMNIIIKGARQAQIDEAYIQQLETLTLHRCEDYPPFQKPAGQHPTFDAASLAKHNEYTALAGAVFDMSAARPIHTYLKSYFGGKDMTLFHLKRLDCSNNKETTDDIRKGRLNQAQQRYLNAYLNEYAREYRFIGHYNYNND